MTGSIFNFPFLPWFRLAPMINRSGEKEIGDGKLLPMFPFMEIMLKHQVNITSIFVRLESLKDAWKCLSWVRQLCILASKEKQNPHTSINVIRL